MVSFLVYRSFYSGTTLLLLTSTIHNFIGNTPYAIISARSGLIVVLLLIELIIQKELLRASGNKKSERLASVLDVGIAPLLLMAGFICVIRLVTLIYPF